MRVAIQGLGEVPTTVLLILQREKPEITHVICSDYQLKHVARRSGFNKTNEEIIREAAKKLGSEVVFHPCDVFDPAEVGEVLWEILKKLDPEADELVINYTGGSAVVRLLLGTLGMVVSSTMNVKILYAIKYPKGIALAKDHTKVLSDIQQTWMTKRRELGLAPEKVRQTQLAILKKFEEHFAAIRPSREILQKYRRVLVPKSKITYGKVVKPLKKIKKRKREAQKR
jgi:hypothetical protein